MSNLDDLYRDLVEPPQELTTVPGRKNITLRLAKDTHEKLDHIRVLGGQSKTVMAEELLTSAIEDVYHRMNNDVRLESWWADRAHDIAIQQELDRDAAEQQAELDAELAQVGFARNGVA